MYALFYAEDNGREDLLGVSENLKKLQSPEVINKLIFNPDSQILDPEKEWQEKYGYFVLEPSSDFRGDLLIIRTVEKI